MPLLPSVPLLLLVQVVEQELQPQGLALLPVQVIFPPLQSSFEDLALAHLSLPDSLHLLSVFAVG